MLNFFCECRGREFLLLLIYTPLHITLAILFLYVILGWSAFVGLGVMVLGYPIPGRVAVLVQRTQVERMKKAGLVNRWFHDLCSSSDVQTDERVQAVTESDYALDSYFHILRIDVLVLYSDLCSTHDQDVWMGTGSFYLYIGVADRHQVTQPHWVSRKLDLR